LGAAVEIGTALRCIAERGCVAMKDVMNIRNIKSFLGIWESGENGYFALKDIYFSFKRVFKFF